MTSQDFIVLAMRRNAPPNSLGHGVSARAISDAENTLGVQFPESFRWFLATFGYCMWPEDVYGLQPGLIRGLHLVEQTMDHRQRLHPLVPRHLVPISPDGWGNEYCLDTSRMEEGECPVVFWNHERGPDQEPVVTHVSFLCWLEEQVRHWLGDELE